MKALARQLSEEQGISSSHHISMFWFCQLNAFFPHCFQECFHLVEQHKVLVICTHCRMHCPITLVLIRSAFDLSHQTRVIPNSFIRCPTTRPMFRAADTSQVLYRCLAIANSLVDAWTTTSPFRWFTVAEVCLLVTIRFNLPGMDTKNCKRFKVITYRMQRQAQLSVDVIHCVDESTGCSYHSMNMKSRGTSQNKERLTCDNNRYGTAQSRSLLSCALGPTTRDCEGSCSCKTSYM